MKTIQIYLFTIIAILSFDVAAHCDNGKVNELNRLANGFYQKQNYEKAEKYFSKILEIEKKKNTGKEITWPFLLRPLNDLVITKIKLSKYEEAKKLLNSELGRNWEPGTDNDYFLSHSNDTKGIASTFFNLGLIEEKIGYYLGAFEYYYKSLKFNKSKFLEQKSNKMFRKSSPDYPIYMFYKNRLNINKDGRIVILDIAEHNYDVKEWSSEVLFLNCGRTKDYTCRDQPSFLLVKSKGPSRYPSNGRGNCAAGEEVELKFIELTKSLEIKRKQSELIYSCLETIDYDTSSSNKTIFFHYKNIDRSTRSITIFDKTEPEKGLITFKENWVYPY